MKRSATAVVVASFTFAAFSPPIYAQMATVKCETGEGQVLEYDFAKNFDGQMTLESLWPLRVASSNCVLGQAGKTSFRGVNISFENMAQAQSAVGAAQVLISLGITDPAAIEQLVTRVRAGIRKVEEERQVKHRIHIHVAEIAEGDKK